MRTSAKWQQQKNTMILVEIWWNKGWEKCRGLREKETKDSGCMGDLEKSYISKQPLTHRTYNQMTSSNGNGTSG